MAIQRVDNVGIVVDDLEAATAFFVELGMEVEGAGRRRGCSPSGFALLDAQSVEDLTALLTPAGER